MVEIIRANNVVKTYPSGSGGIVRAVGGVSLGVERGRLTVLRGKSGSGKTTLINLIGGLDRPDEGRIWVGDDEVTAMGAAESEAMRRRKVGFIFQSVALFGDMTAYENVEFGMRVAGVGWRERSRRAAECLDLVGLTGRIKHIPQELSGGEQQRVAIARAIAHKPDIILADEPTAQLDTAMGLQIIKLFLTLAETGGITFIMTSHDPEIADVAHRVYTLRDGVLSDEL